MRSHVSCFVLALLITSMLTAALKIQPVNASGTIYIRADGSIDPPTAPISTVDNITYVLNDNISQVIVERDNIVVDGGFQWVGGLSMESALVLSGRSNVTVKNTQIWTLGTFVMGTYLAEPGIYVNYSAEIRLINNNFANNVIAVNLAFSNGTIFSGNNIFIKTATPMDTSQWLGISMQYTSCSVISGNNITGCGFGIDLFSSFGDLIFHNNLLDNTQQVNSNNSTTWWDNGSQGNYWSDYNGTDVNHDGVGDTPYLIDADNTDYYPLMSPCVQSGTVYIRADGSIDPPVAPISTVDNVTYTLTGNISTYADGIVVERDNIVLNGSGYTVMGSEYGNGTTLANRRSVTVNNMVITDFTDGIVLESSSNNTLSGNNVTNSYHDILLESSSDNNVLSGNTVVNDDYGFGIYLESSSSNNISGNKIINNSRGIGLSSCSNNSISGNKITNNREGVLLISSSNNTISENIIASAHDFGIIFWGSSNNTVSENIIARANFVGISLEYRSKIPTAPIVYSSDNVIFHNSFVSNPYQALGGLRNVWDDGYPSGGNYWSDYKGTDADHDGIGDTPYVIDANNTDHHLLMNPYARSGTVYIRADGGIDPPDAPISTFDNVTYTLTGNITSAAGIVIERDSILVDGQGYTVQGTWRGTGITLSGRSNVTIKNTEITAFIFGIWLGYSSNNSISGNDVAANSWVGIKLQNCLDINIVNNDITDNDLAGIWLFFSNSSLVSQNRITRTHIAGIILDISSNNTIFENDVRDNNANMVFEYSVNSGVALSSRNRILHNNFINSTWKAITHFSGQPENFWDDGYPSGGNYWSDYNGTDADYDGIGDTEYTIDASNIDHYPLMGMFQRYNVTYYTPPIVPHACSVTVISNSTISDFVAPIWVEHPEVIFLQFNVSGAEGSNGFCRVSFPTAMMNGTYHVSLNGTEIPYTLLPCSNANTSYLYFNYTHPKQRVMIIPEFPSFLILPLFFMATLLAVITYRRKHH